ncbi:MAG: efflux RND transporter periplasmic adaptor subunit [Nannocystis sp.]|nr:efflux RND transporter periplasmic adaptor subunit [Nannocystis sp.]
MTRRLVTQNAVLALLFVVIAGLVAANLVASKPTPSRAELARPEVKVTVLRARPGPQPVVVAAMGEVKAAHELVIQPEVSGRVTERSEHLIPGGIVREGELLVRLDGRDIGAAVAAQQAAVAQASLQLADERSRKQVAESEWAGRSDALDAEAREIALREPHIQSGKASLGSARAQLDKARRDRGRTVVRAPFDAVVKDVSAEPGQIATPQTRLATLVNVDRYWVEVAVPVASLAHLDIPGVNVTGLRGAPAQITHETGPGQRISRVGYIERLLSGVDGRGRMARLLIAVEDPLALGVGPANRPLPLLLGAFVRVELGGQAIADAVALPRTALVDGAAVWLVVDGKLARRDVAVVWRDPRRVLVQGLRAGDAVMLTPLATPTEGLEVLIEDELAEPPEDRGARPPESLAVGG